MAKSTSPVNTAPAGSSSSSSSVSIDDLSAQIAVLKNDIATLTSAMGEFGRAKTEEAKKTAKDTISDATTAGRVKALEAQAQAEEFLRTQPTTALGIAAGIGFLVGIVTARR
jgi:ElaB/YqjD/DUF883 family membrane-anchored ribosome-binding protein